MWLFSQLFCKYWCPRGHSKMRVQCFLRVLQGSYSRLKINYLKDGFVLGKLRSFFCKYGMVFKMSVKASGIRSFFWGRGGQGQDMLHAVTLYSANIGTFFPLMGFCVVTWTLMYHGRTECYSPFPSRQSKESRTASWQSWSSNSCSVKKPQYRFKAPQRNHGREEPGTTSEGFVVQTV